MMCFISETQCSSMTFIVWRRFKSESVQKVTLIEKASYQYDDYSQLDDYQGEYEEDYGEDYEEDYLTTTNVDFPDEVDSEKEEVVNLEVPLAEQPGIVRDVEPELELPPEQPRQVCHLANTSLPRCDVLVLKRTRRWPFISFRPNFRDLQISGKRTKSNSDFWRTTPSSRGFRKCMVFKVLMCRSSKHALYLANVV